MLEVFSCRMEMRHEQNGASPYIAAVRMEGTRYALYVGGN